MESRIRVSDLVEQGGRILAVLLDEDLDTTRVAVEPVADVVDAALEGDPVVTRLVVSQNLVPAVLGHVGGVDERGSKRDGRDGVGGLLVNRCRHASAPFDPAATGPQYSPRAPVVRCRTSLRQAPPAARASVRSRLNIRSASMRK